MRSLILLTALLTGLAPLVEAAEISVIQVTSRPAASLVNVVRPLLGEASSVSAFHDRLVLQATPQETAAVRQLVEQLDRPPRRLLIEVRQQAHGSLQTRGLGYGVRSDQARLGRVPPGSQGQISYRDVQTRADGDSLQRVQALDGRPALIRAGRSVPVYQAHQQIVGNTVVQGFNMQYRDTGSGFFALPRVHGDQVTIEIYQQDQRPMPDGSFSQQQAATVLNGPLGSWLTLGAVGDQDSDSDDRLGRHVTTRRAGDRRLELRVLAVD